MHGERERERGTLRDCRPYIRRRCTFSVYSHAEHRDAIWERSASNRGRCLTMTELVSKVLSSVPFLPPITSYDNHTQTHRLRTNPQVHLLKQHETTTSDPKNLKLQHQGLLDTHIVLKSVGRLNVEKAKGIMERRQITALAPSRQLRRTQACWVHCKSGGVGEGVNCAQQSGCLLMFKRHHLLVTSGLLTHTPFPRLSGSQ